MNNMSDDIIADGEALNDQGDQTPSTNETILDLPDEDEGLGDKANKEPDEEKKKAQSLAIQKNKYREKFLKADEKINRLEEKISLLESKGQSTDDEKKELAAQKYIQDQALKVYQKEKEKEKMEKERALEVFQEQLDEAVESSGLAESDIVDICEEFEVEPSVAVKILKKANEKTIKKPKLPTVIRASTSLEEEPSPEKDKGKSIFQIAAEIKKGLTRK